MHLFGGGSSLNDDSRKRALIMEVQKSSRSSDEKRFLIQEIMMASYSQAVDMLRGKKEEKGTPMSFADLSNLSLSMNSSSNNSSSIINNGAPSTREDYDGCRHYKRKCKKLAPCCKTFVSCRKCHDEDSDHGSLNRFSVDTVKCMVCDLVQPVGPSCQRCKVKFSKYYCSDCHFHHNFDNTYHCDRCRVCMVGRREDFKHCNVCNVCIEKVNFDKHRCIESSHDANCAICTESLNVQKCNLSIVVPFCGHPIHESCLNSYLQAKNFKCPTCMKSLGDMSSYFKSLKQQIEQQPMPKEYNGKIANIICVDCGKHSSTNFHFLGNECKNCGSFNTNIKDLQQLENNNECTAMDTTD